MSQEPEVKFIIVSTKNGRAVQSWSFAFSGVVYCRTPEWAMKFDSEESAQDTKKFLEKNFPKEKLTVMKLTTTMSYTVG